MFGVSSPRRRVAILLLGVLVAALLAAGGCSKKEIVDPYVYDSLRHVTRGDTLSVGFLFEIDAPKFEYVRGNTGIIRDGNLLEFLVAENLEGTHARLAGTLLGVQKTFSPQPTHLVLKRIKRNGVIESDSLKTPAHYTLPRLLRAGAIDQEMPGAPIPEIGWKKAAIDEARATFLPEKAGDALKTAQSAFSRFVYVPRHDLADAAKANPSAEDYAWYVIGDEVSFEVVDLSDGGEWMLNLLKAKDMPLIGAFTVMSLEDKFTVRQVEHPAVGRVVGTIRINWFRYANSYVEGYVEK